MVWICRKVIDVFAPCLSVDVLMGLFLCSRAGDLLDLLPLQLCQQTLTVFGQLLAF